MKIFKLFLATLFLASNSFGYVNLPYKSMGVMPNTPGMGVIKPNTQYSESVYDLNEVLPAFNLMRTERVAIVGIGDSNQGQNGFGWDEGIQYGMIQNGFTMFGTGLASAMENGGAGASLGYKWNKPGFTVGATSGAPAGLGTFMDKGSGGMAPHNYSYGNDAYSFSSNNNGINIDADCPMDVNGTIEFRLWYGTFLTADGNGQMRIAMRRNNTPYTLLAQDSTINPSVPNAYGMTSTAITLSAGTRNYPLLGQIFNSATGVNLEGPLFHTFYIMTNTDKTFGFNYSTLDYRGGVSARTVANDFIQASDAYLDHFFTALRLPLGASKSVIVMINEGLNDRNETLTSLGPVAVTDGDSPEAYADNIQAIINRIKARYTANGWDSTKLYFLIMPSHPISSPDDSELISYRNACNTILAVDNSNLACIDLSKITTYEEMLNGTGGGGANSYYGTSGTDKNHLTQNGYYFLGFRVARELQ